MVFAGGAMDGRSVSCGGARTRCSTPCSTCPKTSAKPALRS
jgi:hypothetical protein